MTAAAEFATVRRCPVRPACAWTDFVKAAACLSSDMAAEGGGIWRGYWGIGGYWGYGGEERV